MRTRLLCVTVVVLAPALSLAAPVDFNRDIKPILSKNCFACHGPDETHREAGLRFDERESAVKVRKRGAVIVPGKPDMSLLIQRVVSKDENDRMPPTDSHEPLTGEQVAKLKQWIQDGAEFAPHWAFVKPKRYALPEVKSKDRVRNSIDPFILAKLEGLQLTLAPDADRYALIRRLSFDLRGLPPTMAEVDAFVKDTSPNAYEKVVDRFLNDSAYGERWARVWLDLARYADSAGYGSDPLRPNMWRYRDWVIDAFNANKSYDLFTIEQIAGDLLPNATLDQKIATAFHRNTMTNTEGGTNDEEFRTAAIKDRVDTTSQVWMGLTMGCAKCHTHKYDPITQTEYYRFYAMFNQSADADRGDESPLIAAPTTEQEQRIKIVEAKLLELRKQLDVATPELTAAQTKWEASMRPEVAWNKLKVADVKAQNGKLESLPDGIVKLAGELPNNDSFTITTELAPGTVNAIRLETFAAANNFVLTGVSATIGDGVKKSPIGKIVRVEIPGQGKMVSLAEVQVFRGGQNIAMKGEAKQSSTDYDGPPKLAIDGNTNGMYNEAKSTTHTAIEANPWWEVSLADAGAIDRLMIWNRTDGGVGDRLSNFRVAILDEKRNVVWEQTVANPPSPSLELSPSGIQSFAFTDAFADHSQDTFPVANALNGKGWAVGPKMQEPHWAVFLLDRPRTFTEATTMTFKLEFQSKHEKHILTQFRLSATNDEKIKGRAGIAPELRAALDVPTEKRTPQHQSVINTAFRAQEPSLKPIRDQIAALEKDKPQIVMLPIMQELPANQLRKTRLLIKGDFLNPGDPVEPGTPATFHAFSKEDPANRLGLAKWLISSENPLTARVAVNRFWAQLFGVGLVETEEDFGSQGEQPSHPELLDHLANQFIDLKWDMKAFLKLIVMSSTYQQSSKVTPDAFAKDPSNRNLSRAPRFRLEAEMVRDQALAISGLLSQKTHGPSVYPPQPEGLWQAAFNGQRTWATSTGEDRYRRGLYTFWRRTVPYPSMAALDAPSREFCVMRRIRTNTPLQAFVTMNDPCFVEASQALARRLVKEGGATPEERIAFGLKLCLARPGNDVQIRTLVKLYQSELAHYRGDLPNAMKMATNPLGPLPEGMDTAELAAWTVVANVLLNLDGVLTKG